MTPRFFCRIPLAAGAEVALPKEAAHHAARVLRLVVGDALTLFDGEGGEYPARLCRIDGHTVVARVEAHSAIEREPSLSIVLIQCLASADRMDEAIRKSVEMGVAAIVPVVSARSVSRLDAGRALARVEHWRQVVVAACEQCGRNRLPRLDPVRDLREWLREPSASSLRLLAAPDAAHGLAQLPRPDGTIELLVGPEGGLAPHEAEAATAAGFRAVRLGPRILRTETAGPAVLAALNALWGDWR